MARKDFWTSAGSAAWNEGVIGGARKWREEAVDVYADIIGSEHAGAELVSAFVEGAPAAYEAKVEETAARMTYYHDQGASWTYSVVQAGVGDPVLSATGVQGIMEGGFGVTTTGEELTGEERWERGGMGVFQLGMSAAALGKSYKPGSTPPETHMHHQTPKEVLKELPPDVAKHPDVRGRKGLPNRRKIAVCEHKRIHKGKGGGPANELTKEKLSNLGREPTVDDVLKIRQEVNTELKVKYED